jgi:hypothetical protein
MRTGSRIIVAIVTMVASILLAAPQASAQQVTYPTCNLPESDADALVILNTFYPNRYTWDHTDLTVAVRAAPNVDPDYVAAIEDAITSWGDILDRCFDGLITLTHTDDVQSADIVVHYVPSAGGVVFAGMSVCGANGCHNVLVDSEFAGEVLYSPEYLYYVTLHELGHALGLGHATNLRESTDLMGYGWIGAAPDPLFSQCDIDALAYIFSWALEGGSPSGPGPSDLESTFDCAGA